MGLSTIPSNKNLRHFGNSSEPRETKQSDKSINLKFFKFFIFVPNTSAHFSPILLWHNSRPTILSLFSSNSSNILFICSGSSHFISFK